jgi:hypothetical protein
MEGGPGRIDAEIDMNNIISFAGLYQYIPAIVG